MLELTKADFVGKRTYMGRDPYAGLIIDAGFDKRIKGNKADQFSFAIDYGKNGVWVSPACAIIDAMARTPDVYPYALIWQEWFYEKLGLTTWQKFARDGYSVDHESAAADDEPNEVSAPRSAAARRRVKRDSEGRSQRELL